MKLEYVTICVNYLDFFKISYEKNLAAGIFDHFIVITDYNDDATYQFCLDNNITVVKTDIFYKNGAVFNKGAAINYGFEKLKYNDWVAFMDADTFVPNDFKEKIDFKNLNKEFMYGTERVLLKTPDDLFNYEMGFADDEFEVPPGFGYGYFLLFNWQSQVIKNCQPGYWSPHNSPNCQNSDWMFRNMWGDFVGSHAKWTGKFDKLPVRVYNLGQHGENHFGRISPEFKKLT
jgi:hypothetical protein